MDGRSGRRADRRRTERERGGRLVSRDSSRADDDEFRAVDELILDEEHLLAEFAEVGFLINVEKCPYMWLSHQAVHSHCCLHLRDEFIITRVLEQVFVLAEPEKRRGAVNYLQFLVKVPEEISHDFEGGSGTSSSSDCLKKL